MTSAPWKLLTGFLFVAFVGHFALIAAQSQGNESTRIIRPEPRLSFDLEVLVDGRPVAEYYARGRTYVEALNGAEYELRIRNPYPERVAVALSVDGLNTIDARHTSAWNASKWVVEPYSSITIGGWQMSSERARRFYFTSERDSYAAKLGQRANFGVISAVIFRERRRIPMPVVPPSQTRRDRERNEPRASAQGSENAKAKREEARIADEDYAATGIGRSVRNDVTWVQMDLENQPDSELSIRYEFYSALIRLGVVPKSYSDANPMKRREQSRGFSPEPY
jgi:hypothetical protein